MAASDSGARRLVLGLGNPGLEYVATRHNLGFRDVEENARRRGLGLDGDLCRCQTAEDGEVLLAAPQTFMNRSGYAARCLVERLGFASEEILVVYDEIHLPLGKVRLRRAGSPAGHRGMESVIESLGTDQVPRLRLGIAPPEGTPPGEEIVSFVLGVFAQDELELVDAMVARAAEACDAWAREGAEAAMRLNG